MTCTSARSANVQEALSFDCAASATPRRVPRVVRARSDDDYKSCCAR
jgi:hypothetical protein